MAAAPKYTNAVFFFLKLKTSQLGSDVAERTGRKRSFKHLKAPGIYSHSLAWVVNVIKKTKGKPINCVRCFRSTAVAFIRYL